MALDPSWTGRDYDSDEGFRSRCSRRVRERWERKDARIAGCCAVDRVRAGVRGTWIAAGTGRLSPSLAGYGVAWAETCRGPSMGGAFVGGPDRVRLEPHAGTELHDARGGGAAGMFDAAGVPGRWSPLRAAVARAARPRHGANLGAVRVRRGRRSHVSAAATAPERGCRARPRAASGGGPNCCAPMWPMARQHFDLFTCETPRRRRLMRPSPRDGHGLLLAQPALSRRRRRPWWRAWPARRPCTGPPMRVGCRWIRASCVVLHAPCHRAC